MTLFARNREREVQGFVLRVVNNNCPEIRGMIEGPRLDRRVNLTLVVLVIPQEKKKLRMDQAFTATTKEFSNSGVGIVLDQIRDLDEVIVAFRLQRELTFVRAKVKHVHPMGGGFYQLGARLIEVVNPGDYPELRALIF